MNNVNYQLNDAEFQAALDNLSKTLNNMQPVFKSISDDWYKTNKIVIFGLKGNGQYIDYQGARDKENLTEYMRWKKENAIQKKPYPMLKAANGRIESGLTEKSSQYTVRDINKTTMVLGIKGVDYALKHQQGSDGMPKRPFIFNSKTGGNIYNSQMQRWTNIIKEIHARRIKVKRGAV